MASAVSHVNQSPTFYEHCNGLSGLSRPIIVLNRFKERRAIGKISEVEIHAMSV